MTRRSGNVTILLGMLVVLRLTGEAPVLDGDTVGALGGILFLLPWFLLGWIFWRGLAPRSWLR